MILHDEASFQIFFGDVHAAFVPADYAGVSSGVELLALQPFVSALQSMKLNDLVFGHQVHGVQGLSVDNERSSSLAPFTKHADFLITRTRRVGLGVATADCLPVVLYDKLHKVLAVVHAGWRGTTQLVAQRAIQTMIERFATNPEDVRAYFGPSARSCCYIVGQEVLQACEQFSYRQKLFCAQEQQIHFNLPLCVTMQLLACGIKKEAISLKYNVCTICNKAFCSYRRQRISRRHMTVAALL